MAELPSPLLGTVGSPRLRPPPLPSSPVYCHLRGVLRTSRWPRAFPPLATPRWPCWPAGPEPVPRRALVPPVSPRYPVCSSETPIAPAVLPLPPPRLGGGRGGMLRGGSGCSVRGASWGSLPPSAPGPPPSLSLLQPVISLFPPPLYFPPLASSIAPQSLFPVPSGVGWVGPNSP